MLAALCAVALVSAHATPASAEEIVWSEWDYKSTRKFYYDSASASAELFADKASLQTYADTIRDLFYERGTDMIGLLFYGYTDRRCSPDAEWVKKLRLEDPCKLDDGVTPANIQLSRERAEVLQEEVFKKLSKTDRDKMKKFVHTFGEGERYAEVAVRTCRADPASCAKDRYANGFFAQRTTVMGIIPTPPPTPIVTPVNDVVNVSQGVTTQTIPVLANDTCLHTTCSVAVTRSSSPYLIPTAVREDGSVDVWIHPLLEEPTTFSYQLLYWDVKNAVVTASQEATVTVNISLAPPPPPPSMGASISLPATRWARLSTAETFAPTWQLPCSAGNRISPLRCENWSGSRAATVTVIGFENATTSLTAPTGYPTNRYEKVSGTAGSATYRFAQATDPGSYFSHTATGDLVLRITTERMNPDWSITVLTSRDVRVPVSASTRIGVVGATG